MYILEIVLIINEFISFYWIVIPSSMSRWTPRGNWLVFVVRDPHANLTRLHQVQVPRRAYYLSHKYLSKAGSDLIFQAVIRKPIVLHKDRPDESQVKVHFFVVFFGFYEELVVRMRWKRGEMQAGRDKSRAILYSKEIPKCLRRSNPERGEWDSYQVGQRRNTHGIGISLKLNGP